MTRRKGLANRYERGVSAHALNSILALLLDARAYLQANRVTAADAVLASVVTRIERLSASTSAPQRNPGLSVVGALSNPQGARRVKLSDDVQAVAYLHCDDGDPYVHGFGDAPISLRTHDGNSVTIRGLLDETGVQMFGTPDGRKIELIGASGQRLWDYFDVETNEQ
jgi:hypothetical protein